jgi:hypothetical protein
MPYRGSPIENVAQIAALIIEAQQKEKDRNVQARGQDITRQNALTQANAPTPLEKNYATYQGMPKADQATADFGAAAGFLPQPTGPTEFEQKAEALQRFGVQPTRQEYLQGAKFTKPPTTSTAADLAREKFDLLMGAIDPIVEGTKQRVLPPDIYKVRDPTFRAVLTSKLYQAGIDLNAYLEDWQATQQFFRTNNQARPVQQRANVRRVMETIPKIQERYDRWYAHAKPSEIRALAKVQLGVSKELELKDLGPDAQDLATAINDFVFELQSVYGNGYAPTDLALEIARENVQPYWGKATFSRALNTIQQFAEMRYSSMLAVEPFTHELVNRGAKGFQPRAGLGGATPTPSAGTAGPPAPAGGGPPPGAQSGDVYLDANGNLQTVP